VGYYISALEVLPSPSALGEGPGVRVHEGPEGEGMK
jgi:hypothetical protein